MAPDGRSARGAERYSTEARERASAERQASEQNRRGRPVGAWTRAVAQFWHSGGAGSVTMRCQSFCVTSMRA